MWTAIRNRDEDLIPARDASDRIRRSETGSIYAEVYRAIRAQIDVATTEIDVGAVTGLFEPMVARAVARRELREQDALLFAEAVGMFLWGLSVVGRHDDATRTRCADALERVLRNTLITT